LVLADVSTSILAELSLIFSPNGPLQFNAIFLPALTSNNVSNVPSPPSAIGFKLSFVSGNTFFIACLIIDVALLALRLPLKESGAIVIFIDPEERRVGKE